jgi:competence protein ComEA
MDMPSISRARALAYATVALFALVVGARFLERGDAAPAGGSSKAVAIEAEEPAARQVVVHVVGAVASPGLYHLDEGSRVDDAIRKAGGATPKAALDLVNLASPVADGQQVLVPKKGESTAAAGSGAPAAAGQRVHLNSATLEQLDSLPGVGPVTAQGILEYRTEHGAFQSVEELDAVPGIGPARLERLKELVDL